MAQGLVVFQSAVASSNFLQQMTLQEAQILTLRVLKQVMEEKLDQHNVQVAQVRWRGPPSFAS
jgi:hypothetical protein